MRDQVRALHRAGKTVLLCSHHLDEVTRLCSHVAVLRKGKLVQSGSLAEMLASKPRVVISTDAIPEKLQSHLRRLNSGIEVSVCQVVLLGNATAIKAQVLRYLLEGGVDIREMKEDGASLEEVFLEATSE
jgi:ABC-2 type transport system ATP-binding protein